MTPALGPPVQIAYVVDDARAAAAEMVRLVGAGPFFVLADIELAWGEVGGESSDFRHTSAYGWWGDVMMELVEPVGDAPSPFRAPFVATTPVVHHVAVMVEDLEATYGGLVDAGLELAARAQTVTGTEFAFVDTRERLGHLVEIYEATAGLRGFYAMVRRAADVWDGRDPVRTLR